MYVFTVPLLLSLVFSTQSPVVNFAAERHSTCNGACQITQYLGPLLSEKASIALDYSAAPRWSNFDMQTPGVVVNVATEHDVLVQYCNVAGLSFFAQGGGSAWANTFQVNQKDVTINLRGINNIQFNADKTQITFQGGATIEEVVQEAYTNGVRVPTGNCNCVGALGSILGGGLGRLMGLYGLGVDKLFYLNVVTAAGLAITVSKTSHSDLWWALLGAGANFGVVTSATMKSYPVSSAQNGAWTGNILYTEDKIEAIVETINNLDILAPMAVFLYYASAGEPLVIVVPYYIGTTEQGKAAFNVFYALDPVQDTTTWTPYIETNDGSNSFCIKGDRKPAFGAGLAQMVPATWRAVWNETIPASSASCPFRNTINFHAAVIPWYSNSSLDGSALSFASNVRDLWRSTDGLANNSTYINFAFDDFLSTVYGNSLPRLEALKKVYDPFGKFDQFFPIH